MIKASPFHYSNSTTPILHYFNTPLLQFFIVCFVFFSLFQLSLARTVEDTFDSVLENLSKEHNVAANEIVLTVEGALRHHATLFDLYPAGINYENMILRMMLQNGGIAAAAIDTDSSRLARRLRIFEINTEDVVFDGKERLSGSVATVMCRRQLQGEMGRGENMHSMLKAGRRPVMNWSIGGRQRIFPYKQDFTLDVRLIEDAYLLEVLLDDFAGDEREAVDLQEAELEQAVFEEEEEQADAESLDSDVVPAAGERISWSEASAMTSRARRPVSLKILRVPGKRDVMQAEAPAWNRARHTLEASGLDITTERVRGELSITLNPDPWVPKPSVPRRITVYIDAPVVFGRIDAVYRAEGDQGKYEGRIHGGLWLPLEGEYSTTGMDGEWRGNVRGRMRRNPGAEGLVSFLAEDSEEGFDKIYLQTGQLLLAARHAALPADHRRFVQRAPEKPLTGDSSVKEKHKKAIAEIAGKSLSAVKQAIATGNCAPEDDFFGPFGKVLDLPESDKLALLPEKATVGSQQWYVIKHWQTLGPFVDYNRITEMRVGLPTVVPEYSVAYLDQRRELGSVVESKVEWQLRQAVPEVRMTSEQWDPLWVASGKMSSYSSHERDRAVRARENRSRSYSWYAATEIKSTEEQRVWLSIQAVDFAQLWINGECVWVSGEEYNPRLPAIFPVVLAAGVNQILVRCGKRSITYFPPEAAGRSRFLLQIEPYNGPRPESITATAALKAAQISGYNIDGGRIYEAADPPLAWSVSGTNDVAWRSYVNGSMPVVYADHLYIQNRNHELLCFDKRGGELLWKASAMGASVHGVAEESDKDGAGGVTVAVPIVTETGIWCSSGSGMTARFAHDGTLRWAVQTGLSFSGGLDYSPLLAEGILLVQGDASDESARMALPTIAALDAGDGRVLWKKKKTASVAGMCALALSAGDGLRVVIVTADGTVFDVESGDVLLRGITDIFSVPLPADDRVVFHSSAGQAMVRLWVNQAGKVCARTLWDVRRSGHGGAAGVIDGANLYIPRIADEHHPHHCVPWCQMDVYDFGSGQHLSKPKPAIRDGLSPLPIVLAGSYAVFSNSGSGGLGVKHPRAQMSFYTRGDDPVLVAYLDLGAGTRLLYPPVFDEERIYLRLGSELICISSSAGDPVQQRERTARALLREIPRRPRHIEFSELPAVDGFDPAPEVPQGDLINRVMPDEWLVCGPVPLAQSVLEREELVDISVSPLVAGAEQKLAGDIMRWRKLADEVLIRRGSVRQSLGGSSFFYLPQYMLDVIPAMDGREHSALWGYTVLYNDKPGTYQLEIKGNAADIYIAGESVKAGDIYSLGRGYYPVVMKIEFRSVPPDMRLAFQAAFREVRNPEGELEEWRKSLSRHRHGLGKIISIAPGTEFSRVARIYLDEIK